MNKHDINQEVQPPSDYLIDNHKTLKCLNGLLKVRLFKEGS